MPCADASCPAARFPLSSISEGCWVLHCIGIVPLDMLVAELQMNSHTGRNVLVRLDRWADSVHARLPKEMYSDKRLYSDRDRPAQA